MKIQKIKGTLILKKQFKISIITSKFNHFIVDKMTEGAIDLLEEVGIDNLQITEVPGAYEIPWAIKQLLTSVNKTDGIIAIGAVIRGETPHFDFVASASSNGISQLSLEYNIPIVNGIITVNTTEQAIERAGTKTGNKGYDAAKTLINLLSIKEQME